METVRILDSYRIALTRNPDAVRLLAVLHRDGPHTDFMLAHAANLPVARVRVTLTELFRAKLVVLIDGDRYRTSDVAETLLTKLGVAELATRELLARSPLDDDERSFLYQCVESRANEPSEWRRYLSAAAKMIARLLTYYEPAELNARVWFATIVGLDPLSHELGATRYCEHVASVATESGRWKNRLSHLEDRCFVALRDRTSSNDFLVSGDAPTEDGDAATIFALTLARLAASVISGQLDDGVAAASATGGPHADALRRLAVWANPFESDYHRFLNDLHLADVSHERRNLIDFLADQLPAHSLWLVDDSRADGSLSTRRYNADSVRRIVSTLSRAIRDSQLNAAEAREISDALDGVRSALSKRMGSPPTVAKTPDQRRPKSPRRK